MWTLHKWGLKGGTIEFEQRISSRIEQHYLLIRAMTVISKLHRKMQ